jgi:hypothetical protein
MSILDNYINFLNNKCVNVINNNQISKKIKKVENNDKINLIPKYNNYSILFMHNYNVNNLKDFLKYYKLKNTGNKNQLFHRLFSFLYLSNYAITIQKYIRGFLYRSYIKLHGPGFKNKKICTNSSDFFTMDELTTISHKQFFSFKDIDGFIYGFDIISFNNLIYNSNGLVKNPYNRLDISNDIINKFRKLLRLSKILDINIITKVNNIYEEISTKKSLELRIVSLFQKMDELGNYTNNNWFMDLTREQLIKLLRELIDIWMYRAHLEEDMKKKICPPNGRPFGVINNRILNNLLNTENIDDLRKIVIEILEKFVSSGIDKDSKCLGTYYVLGCLTLVNQEASCALPWLFQAFNYM